MGKNYRSLEWKTAVCLVFSIFLHAGLIYYVALTQFGGESSGVNQAGEISAVDFQTAEIAPVVEEKVEPKIEVTRPQPIAKEIKEVKKVEPKEEPLPAPKLKIARTLPKKAEIAAAPLQEEAPVEVAKIEQPQPLIEKEEMSPVAPFPVEPMDVEKEVAQEKAVREELVEKIMRDEPHPEEPKVTAPAAEPVPAVAPKASAPTSAPVQAEEVKAAPAAVAAAAPAAIAAPATKVARNLPVKNDYELKAMPGNRDPQYSHSDRMANRQGEVKFMAEVTPEGTLNNIRILKSSGHRSLDLAAYSAFKNYRYYPGQPAFVVKSFVFTLKGPAQVLPSRLGSRAKLDKES